MAKKKKRTDKGGSTEAKAPEKKAAPKPAEDDVDEDSGPRPSASSSSSKDDDEDADHDHGDDDHDHDEDEHRPAPKARAPHAAHAAHHDAHHHKPDRKEYVRIWVYLAVLTVLEVGVAYLEPVVGKTAVVTALVGLALSKAGIVALYYMHLKHESKFMRYTVGFPMVFPALYAFILIAEGAYRAVWGDS
jgi:cytochrome c oxidase subunit IV